MVSVVFCFFVVLALLSFNLESLVNPAGVLFFIKSFMFHRPKFIYFKLPENISLPVC